VRQINLSCGGFSNAEARVGNGELATARISTSIESLTALFAFAA
jgi:hypothetical protein